MTAPVSGEERAREAWAAIELLLIEECGLHIDEGIAVERPNCINVILNALSPDVPAPASGAERCPFCGRDPFHYVDNGVGMEAVAVTCCDPGDMFFRGARDAPEEVTLSWSEFKDFGNKLRSQAAALASKEEEIKRAAKVAKAAEGRSISRGRLLVRFRDTLINVRDGLEDEGDRVYLGSTNDTEAFREAVELLDAFKWDRIMEESDSEDPYELARQANARANAAEAETARLLRERDEAVAAETERSAGIAAAVRDHELGIDARGVADHIAASIRTGKET